MIASKKSKKYSIRAFLIALILFVAVASMYTNADLDMSPVNIDNISTYVLDSSVIIYWDTNIIADSHVKYGLTLDNLNNSNYLGVHSYAHAAELIGLEPDTLYYYVVNSTNANGNSNQSEILSFTTLEDLVPPQYYNVTVNLQSGINYSKNSTYIFSAKWTDNGIMDFVSIEKNISGILSQDNMTKIIGTDNYQYIQNSLAAGNYYWKMSGTDISSNTNMTDEYVFVINKAEPIINLSLNGLSQNLEIEQRSLVNITGVLIEGDANIFVTVSNSSNILNQSTGLANSSMQHFFENPGIYNVSLSYNESENYTSKTTSLIINVTPIEINLFIDKPNYDLGEEISYVVFAPNTSNLSMEICGPLPIGAGFVECKNLIYVQQNNYPFTGLTSFTNKSGTYNIRTQINYKGLTKLTERNYTVTNSLQIVISGDLILKTGVESDLTASATGGIGTFRYNWTLSNGTKISGQNLNIKYNSPGSYPVILTVSDDYGNYRTETITLVVKKHYAIKVIVLDNVNGGDLEDAKVKMNSAQKITDSNGEVVFDLIEGEYDLKVSSSGYLSHSQTITADVNKTLTVRLSQAPINTNMPFNIYLVSPTNNWIATSSQVIFEANVELGENSAATCQFYIAEDNSDWYRVMKTVSVTDSGKITHTESFSSGNKFAWKVQCEVNSKTYASKVWNFNAQNFKTDGEVSLTILGDVSDQIIDAGEIRRRIDSALENIDSLDMESKKDAEYLGVTNRIDKSLNDYDRAMRDINNIIYRRDLSQSEQEVKKLEYYSILRGLENITPLDIKNMASQTFISYPSKEELNAIAQDYQKQKNILGRINIDKVSELQNNLIVTTRVSNVEITYIDGKKETITLVAKILKIKDNATDTFLLESIPKEFAESSDDLILITPMAVVNKDPLFKVDKQETLIYYIKGQRDVELGKNLKTILLSDGQFTTRNAITGDVTLGSIEWTSPTSLIVLIILIASIYLLYAFDVFSVLFEKSRNKLKEENINKILSLIKDAKDFLQSNKIDEANLVFKEIKLLYEGSVDEVREEVYQEAINLLDMIDSLQLEILIKNVQTKSVTPSDEEKQNAIKSRDLLKKAYDLLSESLKQKYHDTLQSLVIENNVDIIKQNESN